MEPDRGRATVAGDAIVAKTLTLERERECVRVYEMWKLRVRNETLREREWERVFETSKEGSGRVFWRVSVQEGIRNLSE